MLEHHIQNRDKRDECFYQLTNMDMVPKSKMWKIYKNASNVFTEMDKEFVNCRRAGKLTLTYTELEQQFNECVKTFEQWSLIAALTY